MYTFIPVLILTLLALLSAAVLTDDEGTDEPDLRKKDTDSLSLSFRLGSGASGSQKPTPLETEPRALAETQRSKPKFSHLAGRTSKTMAMVSPLVCLSIIVMMMPGGAAPGGGGNRDFNYRIPPAWSPEGERNYSFRAYMTDISIWIMLTDLQPHQQCAAIVMRLGGAAREVARMISPQEMMTGGIQNGIQVDPVTYLLGALHARFSALEEESRLTCMTEMLAFTRHGGENINSLLARYDTVRHRAAIEGQFVMSIEACSLQMLRACGISAQHLFTLLQPFQGQFPQTEAQFQQLCTQLRRFGHISEGSPGNIATSLQGPFRQARVGAYLSGDRPVETEGDRQALRTAMEYTGGLPAASFFGRTGESIGEHQGSQGMWDSLLPQAPPASQPDFLAAWAAPGASWSEGRPAEAPTTPAYPTYENDTMGDSTETATSSDDGMEEVTGPDISQMNEAQAAEAIYMQYRQAKRTWRRFTGRPVRRFRTNFKKTLRTKGKGRSKGKRRGFFFTEDEVHAYLKGKGKGKRSHTSGKGHGRKGNPRDREGNVMKCHNCGSEDHLRAGCTKGGGKGGSSSSGPPSFAPFVSDFAGLAATPPQAEAPAPPTEVAPPWGDDLFEPPSSIFMNLGGNHDLGTGGSQAGESDRSNQPGTEGARPSPPRDPWIQNDPWRAAGAQNQQRWIATEASPADAPSRGTQATPAPTSLWGNWRGLFSRNLPSGEDRTAETTHWDVPAVMWPSQMPQELPQQQHPGRPARVNQEDELSETLSWSARNEEHAPPNRATPFGDGLHTPPVLRQPQLLPHNRTGPPNISETQILRILQGQSLTQPTRTSNFEDRVSRTQMMRHGLPLSTAASLSASSVASTFREAPPPAPSTLARVVEAIGVMNLNRQQRHSHHRSGEQHSEAGGRTADSLLAAAAAQPVPVDIEQELTTIVPIIYEGDDNQCTICQQDYCHGERVCRLGCRHVFHSACWERFQRVRGQPIDEENLQQMSCPNCRGAGTMIAVWYYIANDRVTQDTSGHSPLRAENLLNSSSHHDISAPGIQTPPTPPGSCLRSPRSSQRSPRSEAHEQLDTDPFSIVSGGSPALLIGEEHFHINTRLRDGRPSIIVDPGSVGNLCGDKWAKEVATFAAKHGKKPAYQKREKPLKVSGVGNGSQDCHYDCTLPVALRQSDEETGPDRTVFAELTTPAVAGSDLPGLLGLTALRKNRAVIDFSTLRMHFCGPGDIEVGKALPPGSDTFQLEVAPSGHIVLPCCEFQAQGPISDHSLTLMAREGADSKGATSSGGLRAEAACFVPPPPSNPPVFPTTVRRERPLPAPPTSNL